MDILGQDERTPVIRNKWHNAASDDLVSIDVQISETNKELAALRGDYEEAAGYANQCEVEKEGFFKWYSCKNNTGKTLAEWERIADTAGPRIAVLEDQLNKLKADRVDALEAIKQEAIAAGASAEAAEQVAEQRGAESQASAEKGKSIGIWIAVGLVAIAGGFLVYRKIIKK